MALLPLKCMCISSLLHVFLRLLLNPLVKVTTRKKFFFACCAIDVIVVVSVVSQMSVVGAKPMVDLGGESV